MSSSPQSSPIAQTPVSPAVSQKSGYPFPDVRNRQNSISRYPQRRRGSAASNSSLPSIGGSLDIQPPRANTVRETNQNAISTLLQPPIVRTGLLPSNVAASSGYKAPTQKDIPPVALTNIDHIPNENFRDYLSRIGPLFESLQRGRSEPDQAQWLKKDKELEKTDRFAEALERRMSQASVSSPTTPLYTPTSALSPLDAAGQPRRRSTPGGRRNRNEPTPLSTIPPVYFDEDFHLENPRTFDIVSERAEIVRPPPSAPQPAEQKAANGTPLPPRKALATNAILQEKLSWYMDTVEVHLINSISTASTGFFAALGSLKELQTEAEESVAKIQSLRSDLRRLDQEIAVGGLEIAAKRRRRANLEKLGRATAQVQMVVENVKTADALVEAGGYGEAADQMDRVGRLVCGKPEPDETTQQLIDLRPLKALQGLDTGLQDLQLRIGNGFSSRFTSVLMDDLRQHVENVPRSDTLKRWSRQRGIAPKFMETHDDFRKKLLESLKGLQRAGHMAPATAAYREAVNKEMKSIIRKYLPSSSDDDADSMISISTRAGGKLSQQEKSSILARNLRAMDGEDAEKLLINVYTSVGEALRRVSTQTKILLDVTSSMQAPSPPKSPPGSPPKTPNISSVDQQLAQGTSKPNVQEDFSQVLDMSSLLEQAVDTAQTQITRVLKVRNEQTIRLPMERFLRYFTLNRLFADECEAVSGRGGQALKGIINAQISGFVQVLGTSETERITNLLDNDSWNAQDFGEAENKVLQRILGSASSDPAEWKSAKPIWEDAGPAADGVMPNGEATTNGTSVPNGQPTSGKSTAKPAYIDDTKYVLVGSAIALLTTIDTFLSLTAKMQSMTPQISTNLLDVLRTFDSRSRQLILGAGATRVAGLKNITTKHLALASQGLSFIIALVPYMRECVRQHLPSGQTSVLAEFDKTKRLCQDHQSGLHDKLIEIMTTRSQAHVKAMKALDFDIASATTPSAYVETLTKETLTLYRVLSRHLNEFDVGMIMRQIFAAYKEQWTQAFAEVEIKTDTGEKVLLRDAEVFEQKLGKVEGFESVGKDIIGVVRARVDEDGAKSEVKELKDAKEKNEATEEKNVVEAK